jgi:hypothetical protein
MGEKRDGGGSLNVLEGERERVGSRMREKVSKRKRRRKKESTSV